MPKISNPSNNLPTKERIALGKMLFFDSRLSRDGSISCASCHLPNNAFSDTISLSLGVEKRLGTRNAPSLINVAFQPYFNWDGGTSSLETQLLVPIQEHNEFDFNILGIADRLLKDEEIVALSQKAYGDYPLPHVISRAIACYERTLISATSKYDLVMMGKESFSDAEKKGYNLYFDGRANCSSCHSGFNLTNYSFQSNGIVPSLLDSGRMRVTKAEKDRNHYKVPSLRNVSLTGPYMHDGRFSTIQEVLEHYVHLSADTKKFNNALDSIQLKKKDIPYLLAFLTTLEDQNSINIINSINHKNNFKQ